MLCVVLYLFLLTLDPHLAVIQLDSMWVTQ